MKKILKVALALVIAFTFLSTISTTTASAKRHYTTTPKALRGTWYCSNPARYGYDKIKITKYSFYYREAGAYKGQKALSSKGQLYVSKKSRSGYYRIGFTNGRKLHYKRTTRKGYVALKNYDGIQTTFMRSYKSTLYWLHVKI